MKKITTLFLVTLCSLAGILSRAEVITADIAKETADIFLSLDNEWQSTTDANIELVEKEGVPAYYIIQYTTGGWAIVSAQSSSSPVIGYNTTGEFATPAPVSELLDFNANIITARAKDLENIEHAGWRRVRQRKAAAEIINTPDIAPLIKINLNQSEPFNKYCPKIDGQNTLVGCVAVGMTQAIMVQGYPQRPSGSYSYTCENTGTHSIDYDAQPAYDWNAINNCETTGNYDEVARLLYHAGVSVDMQYGLEGSGTQTDYVAEALIRNFGYDKKIVYTTARHPDSNKWLELIINELAHGRVVVYGGTGEEGGHCWNIDGWKQSTQMVHCNWGWSGYGNGYFSLDNLVDSYQGISFLYNHRAVFGVAALTTAPYDIVLQSTQFAIDTEAGTTLSYVEVLSTDNNATYSYELFGPNGTQSPYQITNNKFTSTERVTDSDKFKYVRIKATNTTTGQSYEKEFNILIVSANIHKLIGSYKAFANSAYSSYPDEEWEVSITADKYDANKLWIQPVCIFGGLSPTNITALYATYNEATSTLTMPIGQILYESPSYKMITGISRDNSTIETSGDITLQITSNDKGIVISFPTDIVFGVGNALDNEWWYQVLENITFTKQQITTAPYGIELSTTTFTIDTKPNTPLADVAVLCDDKNASFNYEVYDREGNTSPYKVVNNVLVSSETIADNDTFKYMRIKATNTLTGEAYEQAFDIQIVENKAAMFVGEYTAFANSAFKDYPDEEWVVNITADNSVPNKIWIQPICLFGGLEASDIEPVYATYDVAKGTLTMPLGQTLFQQADKYQMIIGATVDGSNINTTGSIEMQVSQSDEGITITFATDCFIGVGNAIGNEWWYQALTNVSLTRSINVENKAEMFVGEYTAFANSAFKDYPDEEWVVNITADNSVPNKIWIQPICLFSDLNPQYINPVYAIYNGNDNTLTLPLGQVLYEQDSKYRMILGASFDSGESIDTNGNLTLSISTENDELTILFENNVIVGVGNAIEDAWWYQALYNIEYTKRANNNTTEQVDISKLAGDYNAFAHSAFKDYPDEEWQVNISIDPNIPDRLWIQPVCLFADLSPQYINAVYATYDAETGIITMPLGQVLYEQDDKYRIITGASFDGGASRDTSGNILFYVTSEDENIVIEMDSNAVIGVGNAVTDQWWWQALYDMTYTKIRVYDKIYIDGIYYNITSDSKKTAQVSYKGNRYDEYSNEYSGEVIIPETIIYEGSTYTVTSIEEHSFYFCTGITYVSIPSTVTEIGNRAFYNCVSITELNVNAEEPPVIYAETFLGVDKAVPLYVPDNSIEMYRTAEYWREFTNYILLSNTESYIVNDCKVLVHNGSITLTGIAEDAVVNIYSIHGLLMHSTTAGNIGNIILPRGMYIMQIEDNSYKIIL